jgi:O-6-methylguanine DNA methyltransferase
VEIRHALLLTVAGPLLALASERGLMRLRFLREAYEYRTEAGAEAEHLDPAAEPREDAEAFSQLVRQLGEYFSGQRRDFDVPCDLRGSAFQLGVWNALRNIPYGRIRSYRQIARALGQPRAARAVGQAVRANPVPIVVPCHRVIGTDGHLVGFGGGVDLKARLLRLEGHTLGRGERVVAPQLF